MRRYGRLRRRRDIALVRERGRRAGTALLALFALAGRSGRDRVAVTVSKTVGGAVVRNLVRRRLHGALDALAPRERPAADLLFIVRPEAAQAPFARLAEDVAAVLARANGRP